MSKNSELTMAMGGNIDTASMRASLVARPGTCNLAKAKAAGVPSHETKSGSEHRDASTVKDDSCKRPFGQTQCESAPGSGASGRNGGRVVSSVVGFSAVINCHSTGKRQKPRVRTRPALSNSRGTTRRMTRDTMRS